MSEQSKVKKITLSLDEQTLDLLEKYKEENFLSSKSQAIRVLVKKNDSKTNIRTNQTS